MTGAPQSSPRVVIFAGPNGAGKSTHANANAILAALGIETFVNADYIARGLSGRHTDAVAIEAGRIMLRRLRQLGDARADFAFESTLSSRSFTHFLHGLKAEGYAVAIYYFSLTNAQLAIRRDKLRVALGGHDVPADVVKRRFGRSLQNFFQLYVPFADIGKAGTRNGRRLWSHGANRQNQDGEEYAHHWLNHWLQGCFE